MTGQSMSATWGRGAVIFLCLVQSVLVMAGSPAKSEDLRRAVWVAVASELKAQGRGEETLPRIEDLELPGALPAVGEGNLRASAACWDARARRTRLRLQCIAPAQCLPFLVSFDSNKDAAKRKPSVQDKAQDQNKDEGQGKENDQAEACKVGAATAEVRGKAAVQQTSVAQKENPIRAGDRATAVFRTAGLRMSASVVCLDRGSEGEIIRVRSQNGQVFRARISGPALLDALPE
jgi:hypothetical protein